MRILGVDPGLTRCGIGVIDVAANRQLTMVHTGVIQTSMDLDLPIRLMQLHEQLEQIIDDLKPEELAIERVFSQHNVRSAMGTAQASAIAMLIAAKRSLPIHMYTPTEVKAAVSGSGRANKEQVTTMVTRLLRLEVAPHPADAADALALAMCHAWKGPNKLMIAQAVAAAKPTQLSRQSRTPRVAS